MAEEINITVEIENELSVSIEIENELSLLVELPITVSGGLVTIIDQDENVVTTVASGGTYQVTILSEIDDTPPYETLVIDDN